MPQEQDVKGSKDHPLLSRMPDFRITGYKDTEYDSYRFNNQDKKLETIEGHKYYIEYNLNAGAVVNTLITKYGILSTRLKSYGVASLAPVASNDTEEGKAKNRPVELVKQ